MRLQLRRPTSRFRVNAFVQQRAAAAFRNSGKVLALEELNAPKKRRMTNWPRAHLVHRSTGSAVDPPAAMCNYVNENEYGHILTIEDPIEFPHESSAHQPARSRTARCRSPMRCAARARGPRLHPGRRNARPRDDPTRPDGPEALVFGTLHTSSAAKTIDRIIDALPAAERNGPRAAVGIVGVGDPQDAAPQGAKGPAACRARNHDRLPGRRNGSARQRCPDVLDDPDLGDRACRRSTSARRSLRRNMINLAEALTARRKKTCSWRESLTWNANAPPIIHEPLDLLENGTLDLFIANFRRRSRSTGRSRQCRRRSCRPQHTIGSRAA